MNLNKPGKLTEDEYEIFKKHPGYGRDILEPIKFLHPLIPGVHLPPRALGRHAAIRSASKGKDIPLIARIISVADTYDAMTSDRAYRRALPHEVAITEITRCSGTQFDPTIASEFIEAIEAHRNERTDKRRSAAGVSGLARRRSSGCRRPWLGRVWRAPVRWLGAFARVSAGVATCAASSGASSRSARRDRSSLWSAARASGGWERQGASPRSLRVLPRVANAVVVHAAPACRRCCVASMRRSSSVRPDSSSWPWCSFAKMTRWTISSNFSRVGGSMVRAPASIESISIRIAVSLVRGVMPG